MAAGVAPNVLLFQPADLVPIVITENNADLDGAGTFIFRPELDGFAVDPPAGGNGLRIIVRLRVNSDGRPISCDIGQSDLPHVAQAGCAQLMTSASFHLYDGFALPFSHGIIDVEFSFFKDAPGAPKGKSVFAFAVPGYVNTKIVYPEDNTPADQILSNASGSFAVPITSDDYPPIAVRYDIESLSSVLVGISRDGKPRTCRPITAPSEASTAYLDNYTCYLIMRRGHFEFQPTMPAYDGLRYVHRRMSWKMPS